MFSHTRPPFANFNPAVFFYYKVVMEVAKIIREDFLQQNAFTDYDFTCPLVKSIGMLRTIITFYNNCQVRRARVRKRVVAAAPAPGERDRGAPESAARAPGQVHVCKGSSLAHRNE